MRTKRTRKAVGSEPTAPNPLDGFEARVLARVREYQEHPDLLKAQMEIKAGNPITLGPRVTDPTSWAEDQVKAAKDKAAKWLEKSKRPKKVPSKAALDAKEKYRTRLEESLAGDFWAKAMGQVDEDLRMQIIDLVGSGGFSSGVEKHKPKVVAKVKKLHPLVLALAQEIDAMPVGTDSEREARMLAARRGMLAIGKVMKGA